MTIGASRVTVIVEGQEVGGWLSGNIFSSCIHAADTFVLRIPVTQRAFNALRRDARVTVQADGVTLIDGFVDRRFVRAKAGTLEIQGRDRVGRLIDESAPAINYTGMSVVEAIKRLASPWFGAVTIDNSRNRILRRGKGKRVAGTTEPVVTINVRVPRQGKVHPGESRWQVIHEIASRAGLVVFSSADGRELFVGKPNQAQDPQYLFAATGPDNPIRTNAHDLHVTEDDGERYSMIMVAGVGGQSDTNFGTNVTDNRGVAFDNPFNRIDGTGRDFNHPKRLFMPERSFDSFNDAARVAAQEQARRDYHRHVVTVEMSGFGQALSGGAPTVYATDTVARVIYDDIGIDDTYWISTCSYSFDRETGDVTTLNMVPTGTEVVL